MDNRPTSKIEIKRAKILKISKRLFKENGYSNTTIKMITDAMKFKNQASLYRYFNNKEEIGILILREFTTRVVAYMEDEMRIKEDPLLLLALHELLIYELILTDYEAGRFAYELNRIIVYPTTVMLSKEYSDLIKNAIQNTMPSLSSSELTSYLIFFTCGFAGLFMSIVENQKHKNVLTFNESLNILLSMFQLDVDIRKKLYQQAVKLYRTIPQEKLKGFALLD